MKFKRYDARAAQWGLCLLGSTLACLPPKSERIDCENSLPPDQASFAQVRALFQSEDNQGCAAGNCHGDDVAEKGYRFDVDSALYDALTTHIDSVYAQVSSGEMPPAEEQEVLGVGRWQTDDLRVLSSWYCNGAFPNE